MKIYLMRHFKVNFSWKKMYNSADFDIAYNAYDNSLIIPKNIGLNISFKNLYISHLSRTNETFKSLRLTSTPVKTDLLNEVPLKSFTKLPFKIPTTLWFVIGRIQWYFNISRQIEGKRKTNLRIKEFLALIEKEKQDCLIIGHGFYFAQMRIILKKNGYLGHNIRHYKNGQVVEFIKNASSNV